MVYGLPLSMINQLTRAGTTQNYIYPNSILVAAGDKGGTMSTVYQGVIYTAFGEFESMPDVPLNIVAYSALADAVRPVGASSFPGSVDAATIMEGFAKAMNLTFRNGGVSVMLSNPYFKGTLYDQVRSCAMAANINFSIDRGAMAIWPKTGALDDKPILISPETGLVGYPAFTENGVILNTLFNSSYKLGTDVEVQSSLTPACGRWNTYSVANFLASETPGGPWYSQVGAQRGRNV